MHSRLLDPLCPCGGDELTLQPLLYSIALVLLLYWTASLASLSWRVDPT